MVYFGKLKGISKVILDNQKLPSHITGEEGMKDMKVIESIYKAARLGKRVLV
jgi:predicted dehydrogenase